MQTIKNALSEAVQKIKASTTTAHLDAEILLAYVLKVERFKLITQSHLVLLDTDAQTFNALIERRVQGEPVAYLIGKKSFMGLTFTVKKGALIPRPDTELLVETVLERSKGKTMRGLEIGVGSGAIALSLLYYNPILKMTGVDIEDIPLQVTHQNATDLSVKDRLTLLKSDVYDALSKTHTYDFIVSNPPYIESKTICQLMKDIVDFEPIKALDGGVDGLYFYRKIIKQASRYLIDKGTLYFEVGYNQAAAVAKIMEDNGFYHIEIARDLQGHQRVVYGVKRSNLC